MNDSLVEEVVAEANGLLDEMRKELSTEPGFDPSEVRRKALDLRRDGHSYEGIAAALSDRHRITPWRVYAWTNPQKSPEQVAAWADKHHPDEISWKANG
jgi:hypothetical protein